MTNKKPVKLEYATKWAFTIPKKLGKPIWREDKMKHLKYCEEVGNERGEDKFEHWQGCFWETKSVPHNAAYSHILGSKLKKKDIGDLEKQGFKIAPCFRPYDFSVHYCDPDYLYTEKNHHNNPEKWGKTKLELGEYISGPYEFGEVPQVKGQGFRSDVAKAREMAKDFSIPLTSFYEELMPQAALFGIKYRNQLLKEWGQNEPRVAPEVSAFYGPTCTGKTESAYEYLCGKARKELGDKFVLSDVYIASDTENLKWWDLYRGQKYVVLDEVRATTVKFERMLRLLDKYPMLVESKCGMCPLRAEHIVITSPVHPSHIYGGKENIDQFVRRIKYVVEFERDERPIPAPKAMIFDKATGCLIERAPLEIIENIDVEILEVSPALDKSGAAGEVRKGNTVLVVEPQNLDFPAPSVPTSERLESENWVLGEEPEDKALDEQDPWKVLKREETLVEKKGTPPTETRSPCTKVSTRTELNAAFPRVPPMSNEHRSPSTCGRPRKRGTVKHSC